MTLDDLDGQDATTKLKKEEKENDEQQKAFL